MGDVIPNEPESLHEDLRLDPLPSVPVQGDECVCPQCADEFTEALREWFR